MRYAVIILLVLGLATPATARQSSKSYFPSSLYESTVKCGLSGPRARLQIMDDFRASWYGKHLSAAGEAALFQMSGPTLRFTWLRTFHAPVVIRVDTTADGSVTMTATELSGAGGYEPGTVSRRIERRLSDEETAALVRTLEDTAVLEQPPRACDLGLDGAQWIIESVGPNGYWFVDRQSPRDGPVRELGLLMLGSTDWAPDPIY
ncbi:hypothetical protein BH10PSE1_BH10PSE1_21200 [soil metagenome]